MSTFPNFKKCTRYCGGPIFALALLLFTFVSATLAQSSERRKADPTDHQLQIKLNTMNWTLPCGSSVDLIMELTNPGPEVLKIDKGQLWFELGYLRTDHRINEDGSANLRSGGSLTFHDDLKSEFLAIQPGEVKTETLSFPLHRSFFYESGSYAIFTTINYQDPLGQYRSIDSNFVDLELFNCSGTPENEEQP